MAKQNQAWHVQLVVSYSGDHPRYPGVALRVRANVSAQSATDAAEQVLAAGRAHWPKEWVVEEIK